MHLFVVQKPVAKKRPRFYILNGKSIVYDGQSSEKRKLKLHFASQMIENGFKEISNEPIHLEIRCYIPIPKSLSKAKQTALEGMFCVKKPDLDNYVKYYSDVLSGIAFTDDNLVSTIWCEKRYSLNPRVEIQINDKQDQAMTNFFE